MPLEHAYVFGVLEGLNYRYLTGLLGKGALIRKFIGDSKYNGAPINGPKAGAV